MDEWPDELPLGSSVAALYLGETDPAVVYPAEGSMTWLYVTAFSGFAIVILGGVIKDVLERRSFARRMIGYEPKRVRHELDPE